MLHSCFRLTVGGEHGRARSCRRYANLISPPRLPLVARTAQTCTGADSLFFLGFNLILWTKRLILEEHGVRFNGFLTATLAALLVGKAVLVTDNLAFMRRFDGGADHSAHLV